MFNLTEKQIEANYKQAQDFDFINIRTIGAGRYGGVCYEALREYQPAVFCKFGFEETLEDWVKTQNEIWLNREMDLFVKFKEELDELPVLVPMDKIHQATQAQEHAREIILKEIVNSLPVWEDIIDESDMISSF